jgi:hypothetical protein
MRRAIEGPEVPGLNESFEKNPPLFLREAK